MTHEKAQIILGQMDAQPLFSRNMDNVVLAGEYTIEQLHAIFQLMEYNG